MGHTRQVFMRLGISSSLQASSPFPLLGVLHVGACVYSGWVDLGLLKQFLEGFLWELKPWSLNEGHHHFGPSTPGTSPLTPLTKMTTHYCAEALHEQMLGDKNVECYRPERFVETSGRRNGGHSLALEEQCLQHAPLPSSITTWLKSYAAT